MAQDQSSKNSDPAALAFSAVENALKDSVFTKEDGDGGKAKSAKPKLKGPGTARMVNTDAPHAAPSERLKSAEKIARRTGRVANDDSFANSHILYGLQKRPSAMPFILAVFASIVWLGLTGLVGWLRFSAPLAQPGGASQFIASADFAGLLAIMSLPVLGFFGIAILVRRAQDLRIAAATMTEAAIRMTEPETTAADKVATVGQAVRREVNALGDGLERALSRAGELEVMVHNEVTSLERTYSENESRLRSLIQDLAEQRDSVTTNAERVREAIAEAHALMVSDLDRIGGNLGGTITERGDQVRNALETVVGKLEDTFGERSNSFVTLIESRTTNLIGALDERSQQIDTTLEDRSTDLNELLDRHSESFSTQIQTRLGQLSSEIDNQTAMVVSAIDERAGALASALDTGNQTLADTIEGRGATLLENFNTSTGDVVNELTERGAAVNKALEDLTGRVVGELSSNTIRAEKVLGALAAKLDESISVQVNSLESRFQTALIEISDVIDTSSDTARQNFIEASTDTLNTISGRVEEVSVVLDARLQAMDSVVGDKGERLIDALDTHAQSFTSRANLLENALSEKSQTLQDTLDAHTSALVSGVSEKTAMLEQVLASKGNAIEGALDEHTGKLIEGMGARAQLIETSLDAQREAFEHGFDSRASALTEKIGAQRNQLQAALENERQAMEEGLGTRAEALVRTLSTHRTGVESALETERAAFETGFDERARSLVESVSGNRTELETKLQSEREAIISGIARQKIDLESALEKERISLEDGIDQRSAVLAATISEKQAGFESALAQSTQNFSRIVEEQAAEMAEAVDQKTGALSETLGGHTREFAEKLSTRTQQLAEAIGSRTHEFDEVLDARTEQLSQRLSSDTQILDTTLDERTRQISQAIGSRTEEMATTIDDHGSVIEGRINTVLSNVNSTMERRATEVSELITSKVSEINSTIGHEVDGAISRLDNAETGLSARLDQAAGKISQSARSAAESIETAMEDGRTSIATLVEERLGTLPEAITARAEITADRLNELNETLNNSISTAMSELEAGAERVEETLATRVATVTSSISADVEQTAARMDVAVRTALEQIRGAARQIEDLVEIKAVDTAAQLSEKMSDMQRAVTEQSAAFADIIDAKSEQLDRALRGHGNILSQALESAAAQSEETVEASTGRMLDNLSGALGKLNDSNLMLQRILDTATGNLTEIEQKVSTHSGQYSQTVKQAVTATEEAGQMMGQHVGAFQGTVSGLIEQFSTMVRELDGQAVNIDKAAHSLQDAGNFSIDTLESRRGAMEALAESFTARADDIDERMRTFAQSIADTVNATERRLAGARQAMQEALATTSDTVAGQIEHFSKAAGQEGSKVHEQMREAQANLMREVETALAEATSRFNDTAAAMRSTAGQVSKELEATRSELQRGVLELPEETRASAAAMRQVVAEQIEALNELNSIVRAQPATSDLNTRQPGNNARASFVRSEPRPGVDAQTTEARRPEAPQRYQAEATRTQPRVPPVPASLRHPGQRSESDQPLQSEQRAPLELQEARTQKDADRRQSSTPARPGDNGKGADWLRDVLRNASASQQAGGQRGNGLGGLTNDIAEAIESDALWHAWQRYQAGEQNAFTRRLYTLSGQATYEDVRRKLQQDHEFAATAKAYIEEFEQLLQRASSSNSASGEMRGLLLSDRGKVYTMLAHASGRLS